MDTCDDILNSIFSADGMETEGGNRKASFPEFPDEKPKKVDKAASSSSLRFTAMTPKSKPLNK